VVSLCIYTKSQIITLVCVGVAFINICAASPAFFQNYSITSITRKAIAGEEGDG